MNISIDESSISNNYIISAKTTNITSSNSFRDPCKYFYALDINASVSESQINIPQYTNCIFSREQPEIQDVSLCN